MIFTKTSLEGAYIIDITPINDNRGFFSRTWCNDELESHKLDTQINQCSISFNTKKGTLRGLHYQSKPFEEAKTIRCTMGSIYDVIVDIRPESNTYKKWFGINLSSSNRRMLYIPKGFAHGFQTLEDNTEVYYQISEQYHPEYSHGIHWNDPELNIDWPIQTNMTISEKDQHLPLLT